MEETISRFKNLNLRNIDIVTNKRYKNYFKDIHKASDKKISVVYEAIQKNTGPSVLIAALLNPKSTLIISPSDHYIDDISSFTKVIKRSLKIAAKDKIVSIGIKPSSPNEHYGYIQKGTKNGSFFEVIDFKEKPNKSTAKKYFESKKYLWNSGIFICKASLLSSEFSKFEPEIFKICSESISKNKSINDKIFKESPSKSIDHALMEKTNKGAVVEATFEWSDLGSWDAIFDISKKDFDGNASYGVTNLKDSKNTLIKLDGKKTTLTE